MKMNENMESWEIQKAGYLLTIAGELGMDVSGYGELSVNGNSGNVYLWLEGYPFCFYMPINCELKKADIWVLWSNPEDGEEIEIELENKNLDDLYTWVEKVEKEGE